MTRRVKSKITLVVWDDAVASTGWKPHNEAEQPQRCTSVGLLVSESDDALILAGSWGPNDNDVIETNNRISIPLGWIVERKELLI